MNAVRPSLVLWMGVTLVACLEAPDLEGRECAADGACPSPFVCNRQRRCVRSAVEVDAGSIVSPDAGLSDGAPDAPPGTPDANAPDSSSADSGPRISDAASPDVPTDASTLDATADASSADALSPDGMIADSGAPAELTESNASAWGAGSSPYAWSEPSTPRCMAQLLSNGTPGIDSLGITVSNDTGRVAEGASSLLVTTESLGFTFFWFYPRTIDGAMDLSASTEITLFFDAENTSPVGWQGTFPAISLCSSSGSYRELYPGANLLPLAPIGLVPLVIPIGGGNHDGVSWVAREGGPNAFDPSSIDWIELAGDAWEFPTTRVWIDGLRFR